MNSASLSVRYQSTKSATSHSTAPTAVTSNANTLEKYFELASSPFKGNPLRPGRFVTIAAAVTKADMRALIHKNSDKISILQSRTLLDCLGKGRVDSSSLKLNSMGVARLTLERKGYESGYQRMSYEIDSFGSKGKVVQTAFDNEHKLVRQSPQDAKNNLFDVKKVVRKNAKK